jgi:hypothetical protein
MGNSIRLYPKHFDPGTHLEMSNGMTSVFIATLVLSGSTLAQTEREKEWVIWLAARDQGIFGIGTVGFCIGEMPWTQAGFEDEKKFLIRVIEGAKEKLRWDVLNYTPREDWVMECLDTFHNLINLFDPQYINEEKYYHQWRKDTRKYLSNDLPQCEKHGVYLHWVGCVLCHNT